MFIPVWTHFFINGDFQEFENMFIKKSSSELHVVILHLKENMEMFGSQKHQTLKYSIRNFKDTLF